MTCGLGTFSATLYAARNLKLPVRWKVSVARKTSTPRCAPSRGASTIVVGRGESALCTGAALRTGEATASGTAIDESDMRWTGKGEDALNHNGPARQPQVFEVIA